MCLDFCVGPGAILLVSSRWDADWIVTFDAGRFSSFCFGIGVLHQQFPGLSITSWGRSTKHNIDVGGVPGSQHEDFTACDAIFDSEPNLQEWTDALAAVGLHAIPEIGAAQVAIGAPHDHWHIQLPRR